MITLRFFCPSCNKEFRHDTLLRLCPEDARFHSKQTLKGEVARHCSQEIFVYNGGRCDDCLAKAKEGPA